MDTSVICCKHDANVDTRHIFCDLGANRKYPFNFIFVFNLGITNVTSATHTFSRSAELYPVKQTFPVKWEACSARCHSHFLRWINSKVLQKGEVTNARIAGMSTIVLVTFICDDNNENICGCRSQFLLWSFEQECSVWVREKDDHLT